MHRLDLWIPLNLVMLALVVWRFFPELPRPDWLLDEQSAYLTLLSLVVLQLGLVHAIWRQQYHLRQRIEEASLAKDQALLRVERMQFDQRRATWLSKQAEKDRLERQQLLLWHSQDLNRLLQGLGSLLPRHHQAAMDYLNYWHDISGQIATLANFTQQDEPAEWVDLVSLWQDHPESSRLLSEDHIQVSFLEDQLSVCWPVSWAQLLIKGVMGYLAAMCAGKPAKMQCLTFIHSELGEVVRIELHTQERLSEKELRQALCYTLFRHAELQPQQKDIGLSLALVGQLLSKLEGQIISEQDSLVIMLPRSVRVS